MWKRVIVNEDRHVPFDSCMYNLMVFVYWFTDRGVWMHPNGTSASTGLGKRAGAGRELGHQAREGRQERGGGGINRDMEPNTKHGSASTHHTQVTACRGGVCPPPRPSHQASSLHDIAKVGRDNMKKICIC